MQAPQRIGVIGVGKMGGGLARTLARGGYDVTVHDLSADAVAACVAAGARAAGSAAEAASGRDLVITSLPLPGHVVAAYRDIADALEPGAICMDVSTIDPTTARSVSDALAASGHPFVACLLGKGPAQAEAGEVPLFVGGDDAAVDALADVFACIGDQVHRLGSVEAATAFKLVSNLIGMANLAALAEGYQLCRRAGVGAEAFAAALADTGGWSYQATLRLPWLIAGDFAPRFPVALGVKDVRLAVDMAAQWGIAVPVGAAGLGQLASAQAHGWGGDDVAAVLKVVDPLGFGQGD